MKEHLVIKVMPSFLPQVSPTVPYWHTFIADKSIVVERFHPDFDRILAANGFAFWVTHEYAPQSAVWNTEEIHAGLDRTFRIILQQDGSLDEGAISQIRSLPFVEEARGLLIGTTTVPRPSYAKDFSLTGVDPAELIYLSYAKSLTTGNADIKIGVLDTGVDLQHPELQDTLTHGFDFVDLEGLDTTNFIGKVKGLDDNPVDYVGHGTHVSGIIGAKGLDMNEGVAPGCKIMPVRVLAAMKTPTGKVVGAGIVDNINAGIKWAVDHGADIINMSLGVKHDGGGLPHEDVIKYALSKNVTVVAASGNDGTGEKYYPGALDGVIAVGAVGLDGVVTGFTSYGASITVVAPGVNIYSSWIGDGYALSSGTSQASPFVAGGIALMKSFAKEEGKKLTNKQIQYVLSNSSDRTTPRLRDVRSGYGILNLADSFKLLRTLF